MDLGEFGTCIVVNMGQRVMTKSHESVSLGFTTFVLIVSFSDWLLDCLRLSCSILSLSKVIGIKPSMLLVREKLNR